MSYKCEVKEQPTQLTLSIRTRTSVQDLAQVLGKAYGAIAQYLGELGEQPVGPSFAAYYNMDMQNLDVEIGFPVSRRLPGKDDMNASEIPGGKVATCLYTGPYSEIEPAYNALSQWIKDNGYKVTGVAYEMYLNDPMQTLPQELRTQIVFPLKAGSEDVTIRQVGDMLIASIRFRGEYDEVPQRFGQLYEQVQPYVAGKGILLHHYFDESVGAGHDLEVCYPVSQPVETEEVKSWMLEGGQMLCALHVGPLGMRGEPGSISDVWQKIWGYARQHEIIPDSVPRREVYLEDAQEHGDNTAQYVTEVQLAYAFYRMEKLAENLGRFAGEAVRREVMADSEGFPWCSAHEKATWFKGAMERLDSMVDDEDTRRDIMITVGDQFPRTRIQMLRDVYQRTGDLDGLLEIMRADRTLGDLSWYEAPVREGNVIHVTKDPYSPKEYQKATSEHEKRAAYCHCGRLREAIRAGMTMSGTYCYCGAGWYKQLWEGILGQPVRIEVLKSVLQGDDRCTFAIHLPLTLVEGLIERKGC